MLQQQLQDPVSQHFHNWALSQQGSRGAIVDAKGTAVIIQCDEPVVDAASTDWCMAKLRLARSALERWRFEGIHALGFSQATPSGRGVDSLTACLAGMDVDLVHLMPATVYMSFATSRTPTVAPSSFFIT